MKQYFLRYPALLSILYMPVYFIWFQWLQERQVPRDWIISPLDRAIPFCSWFVIPYLLWFVFIAATVVYFFRAPEECLKLCTFLYAGMTICLVIYTLFPNGQMLRPVSMEDNSLLTRIVFLIYRIDPSINVCPSIHVFNTLGALDAILRTNLLREKPLVRSGAAVLSLLIILSTMFLKQHSVIDVIMGFLLALIMDLLIYRKPLANRQSMLRMNRA